MTYQAEVAAVVVAYNGGESLLDCIRSLLDQTVSGLEVIVVDNASTDGSIERAESSFGSDIRVIRRATNGGYAAGANTGWRASEALIIAILNQDLTFASDCLEQMRLTLVSHAGEALVTPMLVMKSDPGLVNAIGNDVHLSGVAWCHGLGTRADSWHGDLGVTAISGAAFMARRRLLEALGGLEESYFMYMEDVDLSFRARLAGAACLGACDAVAAHDWSLNLTPSKFGLLERNRRRVWNRYIGPARGRWIVLVQVETMGWMYAALRGRRHVRAKWQTRRVQTARKDPPEPPDEAIVSILATRYPYEILFPASPLVQLAGEVSDKLIAFCLKSLRGGWPRGVR